MCYPTLTSNIHCWLVKAWSLFLYPFPIRLEKLLLPFVIVPLWAWSHLNNVAYMSCLCMCGVVCCEHAFGKHLPWWNRTLVRCGSQSSDHSSSSRSRLHLFPRAPHRGTTLNTQPRACCVA
jgi:hypothetical protein